MAELPKAAEWRHLLDMLRKRIRPAADAEDHLHSAIVRYLRRSEGEEVHDPKAFLARTAINLAIDADRRRRAHDETSEDAQQFSNLIDQHPLQDEVIEARERLYSVRQALSRLPRRTREIFLMHRLGGMKYREIGAALGISVSTVERNIAKAGQVLLRLSREK